MILQQVQRRFAALDHGVAEHVRALDLLHDGQRHDLVHPFADLGGRDHLELAEA